MAEYIREVEKVIDNYHKESSLFTLNQKTALYNAVLVFEDSCRLGGTTELTLIGDSLEHSFLIREQLDALNILVHWIYADCPNSKDDVLDQYWHLIQSFMTLLCGKTIRFGQGWAGQDSVSTSSGISEVHCLWKH